MVLAFVLSGCAAQGHPEAESSATQPAPPSATTTADPHVRTLVLFGGRYGVAVTGPQDAARLVGAPADLQAFLGHLATTYETSCKHREPIYVRGYDKAGFADASGSDRCGLGAEYVFGFSGGTWHQLWAGQDAAECSEWRTLKIPTEFIRKVVEPGRGADCYESGASARYTYP